MTNPATCEIGAFSAAASLSQMLPIRNSAGPPRIASAFGDAALLIRVGKAEIFANGSQYDAGDDRQMAVGEEPVGNGSPAPMFPPPCRRSFPDRGENRSTTSSRWSGTRAAENRERQIALHMLSRVATGRQDGLAEAQNDEQRATLCHMLARQIERLARRCDRVPEPRSAPAARRIRARARMTRGSTRDSRSAKAPAIQNRLEATTQTVILTKVRGRVIDPPERVQHEHRAAELHCAIEGRETRRHDRQTLPATRSPGERRRTSARTAAA
jgi:hypothetical protein